MVRQYGGMGLPVILPVERIFVENSAGVGASYRRAISDVDGRLRPSHVEPMRGRRCLTLLLLLCGLSTTPFLSLEQSPDDGLTASSVLQCGVRILGKGFQERGSGLGDPDIDYPEGFFGLDAPVAPSRTSGWNFSHVAAGSTVPIPSEPHIDGSDRLTYNANAPPTSTELSS